MIEGEGHYILWVCHNSYEGWSPERFASLEDLVRRITEGTYFSFVVTRELEVRVIDPAAPISWPRQWLMQPGLNP